MIFSMIRESVPFWLGSPCTANPWMNTDALKTGLTGAQQKMLLIARLCDFLRDSSVLSNITQPFTIITH